MEWLSYFRLCNILFFDLLEATQDGAFSCSRNAESKHFLDPKIKSAGSELGTSRCLADLLQRATATTDVGISRQISVQYIPIIRYD